MKLTNSIKVSQKHITTLSNTTLQHNSYTNQTTPHPKKSTNPKKNIYTEEGELSFIENELSVSENKSGV